MTIKASAVRYPIDGENILRAQSAGAITASEASGSKELGVLGAYWNDGEIATPLQFAVVLFVESLDTSSADETYVANVEVDSGKAFAAPVTVASASVKKVGPLTILVPKEAVEAAKPRAGFIRVNLVLGGTTPSIDYWAQLAPISGHN